MSLKVGSDALGDDVGRISSAVCCEVILLPRDPDGFVELDDLPFIIHKGQHLDDVF